MFDLTASEVGKILRLNLTSVDESQNPPTSAALDLTNATGVTLQFAFGSIFQPIGTLKQVAMSIVSAVGGVVQYVFASGDLDAPPGFPFTGKIEFVVKVAFSGGQLQYSSDIGVLTIKEKVG